MGDIWRRLPMHQILIALPLRFCVQVTEWRRRRPLCRKLSPLSPRVTGSTTHSARCERKYVDSAPLGGYR